MRLFSRTGLGRLFSGPVAKVPDPPTTVPDPKPAIVQLRPRDFERWGGDPQEFSDLAAFEAGFDGASRPFSIDLDGLPFDGMFRRGSHDTLFVYFSAAVFPQPDRKLPVFNWVSHSRLCTGSALFLADPVLVMSDTLTLAWYLGTPERPLQEPLVRVITAAARAANASRIAFVGTSGGGFPSLWLTERFPGSAAFVNAPTMTITDHHAQDAVRAFRKTVMPDKPITEFPGVLELPVAPGAGSKIVITQNAGDTPFVTQHLAPYLHRMGLEWDGGDLVSDGLILRMGDPALWGPGHVMPPRDVTRAVLRTLDRVTGPGFATLDLPALHRQMVEADQVPEGA